MPAQGPRVWGVLFTDQGLSDLGEFLKPYLSKGPIGEYLYCREAEMHLSYFRIIVESKNPDGTASEFEAYIPHHYIKAVVAATERRKLGFT
jgi:hypothetical protein